MSTSSNTFTELWAERHRIRVRDYPGHPPAIVLMHGLPDDQHLYDRTLPFLAGRRVVTFDFLGWGESDKPAGYPYTADNQTGDLDAVIAQLGLDEVVLVAHDASGPPAIDWALAHPARVAALVLLNTYYGWMPSLHAPEAITLYSTPILRESGPAGDAAVRGAEPAAVLLAGRAVHPGRGRAPRPAPAVLRSGSAPRARRSGGSTPTCRGR